MNKYAPFFAAYNASTKAGNRATKEDVVAAFTNGRTASLRELDEWELQELVRSLQRFAPKPTPDKADRMRKAIIAIFKSMNRTTQHAISWAEKQGVKGNKKPFNQYTTGELHVLIAIAEKVKADWQKSIRNQLTQKFTNE